ncbi:phospholipase D family protein [Thioalkalivibrio nitratireducens]|nr:phospholipase D family protein [Thioalkalivibrio nitratireducens]
MDVLRPPAGFRIDHAVLSTYSLDLDVLLALPLAVLAHSDRGVDELMEEPLLLLEALREAGERVHVFVDESGIAIPHTNRALYSLLETSVHPVRSVNGGTFHPKVWVVRFVSDDAPPRFRVAIASRNLTFDRSWDVALVSENAADEQRPVEASADLARFLNTLPELTAQTLDVQRIDVVRALAEDVARTSFPAPQGFRGPIRFHGLGLEDGADTPWQLERKGNGLLAIAPFLSATTLDQLVRLSRPPRTLISRREALDALPPRHREAWDSILVLSESALDEPDDRQTERHSDLHAKLIALEHGHQVTWYVGSANLTHAAFTGRNVEVVAAITGPKGRPGSDKGSGIERFVESGFPRLCEAYRPGEPATEDPKIAAARERLDTARQRLVKGDLRVVCRPEGKAWTWMLEGSVALPEGVSVSAWPVSVNEDHARPLELPLAWPLPMSRLTAFVAFRVEADAAIDDVRMALKLPASGIPDSRVAQVLRTLIDSPQRFLQFLRALLGGLDSMPDWAMGNGGGSWQRHQSDGLDNAPLLEDLVRAASRDPQRLEPLQRLIEDLRATSEGPSIVPDDLYEMWRTIYAAVHHDLDQATPRDSAETTGTSNATT